ncbi:uncharacterized protein [Procambarus clarkii]|uniref:uncharacterized protein n=1 Tax=Procambarus clarkii TaxID=6728 RepID=UPI0037426082
MLVLFPCLSNTSVTYSPSSRNTSSPLLSLDCAFISTWSFGVVGGGIQLMWTTSEAGGPGGGHRGTPAVLKLSHWRARATTADNREGDEDGLWVLKNVHNSTTLPGIT